MSQKKKKNGTISSLYTYFVVAECRNTSKLYTKLYALKALFSKIGSFPFCHLLTCKNLTIFWDATILALILHLPFFKCFMFFKFNIPSQKSDMNNSIFFYVFMIKCNYHSMLKTFILFCLYYLYLYYLYLIYFFISIFLQFS